MSWIRSTHCAGPWQTVTNQVPLFDRVQEWVAYIAFAECPQHAIVAAVNAIFILSASSLLVASLAAIFRSTSAVRRRLRTSAGAAAEAPLLPHQTVVDDDGGSSKKEMYVYVVGYLLPLIFTSCVVAILVGITAFDVWNGAHNSWDSSPYARELVFSAVETAAWIASLIVIAAESRRLDAQHPMSLRTWWFASFLLSCLQLLSSIFRLITIRSTGFYDLHLVVYDVFALVKVPAVLAFLVTATNGKTGIEYAYVLEAGESGEPTAAVTETSLTSSFQKAGIWSTATFTWLTPVLYVGSTRSLEPQDIPPLAPRDSAEAMSERFRANWEAELASSTNTAASHPFRRALLRTFWRPLLLCGVLQLTRSIAMFGGPLLISSFSNYVAGDRLSAYDGYALVMILLGCKTVEVFSYHQYNFQAYKMGNNLRTAVVTNLYRKALRLTSSARAAHGVGQITNYMVVDAQQLSDAALQLHNLWGMPLQVVLALAILYISVGIGSLAGLAVMLLVCGCTLFVTSRQRGHQIGLMQGRDRRMAVINEALQYMKVIKMQAWEDYFQEKIEKQRRLEFAALIKFCVAAGINMFNLWNTQPLVCTVTYVTAILVGETLTTARLFTAASLFRILQEPMRNLPNAVNQVIQAAVSIDRVEKFLLSNEIRPDAVQWVMPLDDRPVVIESGRFSWDDSAAAAHDESRLVLKDVDLTVRRGELVTIVGTVGSGKSSLLSAILGEMVKISGKVKVSGRCAYVPQTAWIQNATIQDNILFGAAMDNGRYRRVLAACALEQDLAAMQNGDQTEIGEKGINLSGGQKQRIQLARAIYQDSDVYLLDDVFSAVDAHTGAHLFKECILNLLNGKTILLVTHQVEFLTGADLVLVMKEGRIAQAGKYDEILSEGSELDVLVTAHKNAMNLVNNEPQKEIFVQDHVVTKTGGGIISNGVHENKVASENGHAEQAAAKDLEQQQLFQVGQQRKESRSYERIMSTEELVSDLPLSTEGLIEKLSGGGRGSSTTAVDFREGGGRLRLIEEEQKEVGKVSMRIYWLYLTRSYGWMGVVLLLANQIMWQTLLVGDDYWLADEVPGSTTATVSTPVFLTVYSLVNVVGFLNVFVRVVLVLMIGLKTSQGFFTDMLRGIFRAPMSFFDTTPSGRILSRFSADQTNLDFILHFFFGGFMGSFFGLLGTIVVICISSWPIIFMVIPFLFLFHSYQVFYINSSREITRLDSITKAPLIYHFSETVSGIEVVRCFKINDEFSQRNLAHVNTNMKMDFHNNSANEWLGFRLESLGTTILCTAALLFVALPTGFVRAEIVSLALSYGLGLNSSLYWSTWLYCTVENKMISVERMQQFTNIPSEAARVIKDRLPSTNWPYEGKIVSTRLKLRYRPNTPLVLKGVNFTIEGGHKVGVVGRTGSGKSTLIQAIFRLVEPASGQIVVDGIDISTLGLYDLRSRFSIIPQEPVLFEGTIRTNVDPLGLYTDEQIWQALEKCQLGSIVRGRPEKLDSPVSEYGGNWSLGQSQLLCFTRVVLKGSKILFLDEATASVDSQTDALVQILIRKEFAHCTVVSIAHRIPTVMDADKVLVMDAGRVKEYDKPEKLLKNPDSVFSALVTEYSKRSGDRDGESM